MSRTNICTKALGTWYRLLWNHVYMGTFLPPLGMLESDLFQQLHHQPRDDIALVVGLMKVWSLAVHVRLKPQTIPFDDILLLTDLPALQAAVASLCIGPVPSIFLPPLYRQTSGEGHPFELNESGIMQLFASLHLVYLLTLITSPPITGTDIALPPLHARNYSRLDYIFGCRFIPAVKLYTRPTKENIYILLKHSLPYEEQAAAAGALFDHEPSTHDGTLLAQVFQLADQLTLPLVFADEVLWSTGLCLWLMYDQTYQLVAVVRDRVVLSWAPLTDSCSAFSSLVQCAS